MINEKISSTKAEVDLGNKIKYEFISSVWFLYGYEVIRPMGR